MSTNGRDLQRSYGAQGATMLLVALLIGLTSCGNGNAASTTIEFDDARAWSHLEAQVEIGPRPPGTPELEACRQYIETELRRVGLEPNREVFTEKTPGLGEVEFVNIWVDFPGHETSGRPRKVIVASHYDTKYYKNMRFVGASDGASSTAVLLELARVLTANGPRDVSYRFLFLDGEESTREAWIGSDNLYGSRHHAAQLRRSGEAREYAAFILLDLVGDKDLKLVRDANSDPDLTKLFFDAARKNGLGDHVDDLRGGRYSFEILDDHLPFIAIDIPGLDLIDFTYGGPDNPHWHEATDLPENCSAKSLGIAGRVALFGLQALERRK